MQIMVTGAAGFIGSNLCHWILENTEHTVIGVDNLSGGYEENLPQHKRFHFEMCDIRGHLFQDIFKKYKNIQTVFALAAYASEGRSNSIRQFIASNNTMGMANVINACINNDCKLVFASSVAVYSGAPPFSEETIPNPIDEYGLSKLMTEKSIQIAGDEQGLNWCIVRPRNVYGKRQSLFDPSRNLMGIWMYNILNNLPCNIFGNGDSRRCFTYIDDIVEPLYNAMLIDKEIINLGSETHNSINHVARVFMQVTGYENFINVEERPEVKEAYCDIEKSVRLLGYKGKTDLFKGLTEMWEWAKTVPMRAKQVPPRLEVEKNIHPSLR